MQLLELLPAGMDGGQKKLSAMRESNGNKDPTSTAASRERHGKIDVIGIDLNHLMGCQN